jgi:hypothetical protein
MQAFPKAFRQGKITLLLKPISKNPSSQPFSFKETAS